MNPNRGPYIRNLVPPDLYPSALDDAARTAWLIAAITLAGVGIMVGLWSIWSFISWVLGS